MAASATVEDGEDDLLGGTDSADAGGEDMMGFESSFPAIDTNNEVSDAAKFPTPVKKLTRLFSK